MATLQYKGVQIYGPTTPSLNDDWSPSITLGPALTGGNCLVLAVCDWDYTLFPDSLGSFDVPESWSFVIGNGSGADGLGMSIFVYKCKATDISGTTVRAMAYNGGLPGVTTFNPPPSSSYFRIYVTYWSSSYEWEYANGFVEEDGTVNTITMPVGTIGLPYAPGYGLGSEDFFIVRDRGVAVAFSVAAVHRSGENSFSEVLSGAVPFNQYFPLQTYRGFQIAYRNFVASDFGLGDYVNLSSLTYRKDSQTFTMHPFIAFYKKSRGWKVGTV